MYGKLGTRKRTIVGTTILGKCRHNLAIHHIRGGKISPWLIFLSESGQDLWGGLNDEQISH